MKVSILAAVASNGVIGRGNQLPWRLSSDLKRLKSLTMGHYVIMGRKTFESVGKPLPGRTNIVVTHRPETLPEGVVPASSLEEALRIAEEDDETFILGGAEIYRQALQRAGVLYITQVHADVEGDTFFPDYDDVNEWQLVDAEHFEAGEKDDYPYSFLTYVRKS
ncbi:MAG TPA: dihydrofolate reductase [Thermoanaerobaculia bacterium]|nr:dihydrofolate reductase [Thermoanaerobaculia bacterium]